MARTRCASDTADGRLGRPLAPARGPPRHAHDGNPAAGADRGAHGAMNCVAHSSFLLKPLHTHLAPGAYRVRKHSESTGPHMESMSYWLPPRIRRCHQTLSCGSRTGHHGAARAGGVWAVDDAGLMGALTPVPAAARGARGGSRFEGVGLTCADLLIGGGRECVLFEQTAYAHCTKQSRHSPHTTECRDCL